MSLIINLFNQILYRPLFNILILLYQYLPGQDFGLAIIFLTILIRLILHPLMVRSLKSQKALSNLQPKIEEIQKKYNGDREKQAKELILLYQKERINPFFSFLFLLIQIPILIALYRVFWKGFQSEEMANLYSFVPQPGEINPTFLGLINLSQNNIILAFLAGIFQFFQSKMIPHQKFGQGQFSEIIQKQMLYFFPILTIFILWKLPAAIALYWLATSLFSMIEQKFYAKSS